MCSCAVELCHACVGRVTERGLGVGERWMDERMEGRSGIKGGLGRLKQAARAWTLPAGRPREMLVGVK